MLAWTIVESRTGVGARLWARARGTTGSLRFFLTLDDGPPVLCFTVQSETDAAHLIGFITRYLEEPEILTG